MSKLIRDLGTSDKDYTLAVSVSSAGVELTSRPGVVERDETAEFTVALKTEKEVVDLLHALGAACKEIATNFRRDGWFAYPSGMAEAGFAEKRLVEDETVDRIARWLEREGKMMRGEDCATYLRSGAWKVVSPRSGESQSPSDFVRVAASEEPGLPTPGPSMTAREILATGGTLREIVGVVGDHVSFEKGERLREILDRLAGAVMSRTEAAVAGWLRTFASVLYLHEIHARGLAGYISQGRYRWGEDRAPRPAKGDLPVEAVGDVEFWKTGLPPEAPVSNFAVQALAAEHMAVEDYRTARDMAERFPGAVTLMPGSVTIIDLTKLEMAVAERIAAFFEKNGMHGWKDIVVGAIREGSLA